MIECFKTHHIQVVQPEILVTVFEFSSYYAHATTIPMAYIKLLLLAVSAHNDVDLSRFHSMNITTALISAALQPGTSIIMMMIHEHHASDDLKKESAPSRRYVTRTALCRSIQVCHFKGPTYFKAFM